jgi:chemotaxis protein methyltransferase CheR
MKEMKTYSEPLKAMTASDFERLSEFIRAHCGIKMSPAKKTMLESRLQKRLRLLGAGSFRDYCDLLFKSPEGRDELVHMIDAVTTNKTDFFREPTHFSHLAESVFAEFMESGAHQLQPSFTIWSAGCSTGEEAYTLAIVSSEFAVSNPGFRFNVMATDISTRVLAKAQAGIYDENQISMIPSPLTRKYFLRSKDRSKSLVRIIPQLRLLVMFQRLNLMDANYAVRAGSVDALFCRNVIIYFDRDTQCALLSRLCACLRTGGHLFLGHSETVHGFNLPLQRIASTIYRKAS